MKNKSEPFLFYKFGIHFLLFQDLFLTIQFFHLKVESLVHNYSFDVETIDYCDYLPFFIKLCLNLFFLKKSNLSLISLTF